MVSNNRQMYNLDIVRILRELINQYNFISINDIIFNYCFPNVEIDKIFDIESYNTLMTLNDSVHNKNLYDDFDIDNEYQNLNTKILDQIEYVVNKFGDLRFGQLLMIFVYDDIKTSDDFIDMMKFEFLSDRLDRINNNIKTYNSVNYEEKNDQYQYEKDKKYLRMAQIWSENSYAKRNKVGALIVKDNMIISDGYNGTPSNFDNKCEDEKNNTYPYVLHAESNALMKLLKYNNGQSTLNATLYVTLSPCYECSKLILQSGIKRVVYCEKYRILDGLELLVKSGIDVIYIPKEYLID